LDADCLEVYRQEEQKILRRGQTITPLHFPELAFSVDELLG
jgi:hypothetical protein